MVSIGSNPPQPGGQLVPMRVGSAIVFVEQGDGVSWEEADDRIYPVGPRSFSEAFDRAAETLREVLRVVEDHVHQLEKKARPNEMTVEFSLTFEASGKASIVPILVTGEAGLQTGLKVTAVWRQPDTMEE